MATITDPQKVPFIKGAIKSAFLKGESGASVLKKLQGTSLAIREQDFYRLAREVRTDVSKIQKLWETPNTKPITPELALSAARKLGVAYSFRVQAGVYDSAGNYLRDSYITVNSDKRLTKEEVKTVVDNISFKEYEEEQSYLAYDVLEAYYHA